MGAWSSGSNQQPAPVGKPTTTGEPISEIPQEPDAPTAPEPPTEPEFETPKPPEPEIKITPPQEDILPTIELPAAPQRKERAPKPTIKPQHSHKKSKQYTMKNAETIVRNSKQLHNRRMTKPVQNKSMGFVQFQIKRNTRESLQSNGTVIIHTDEIMDSAMQVDISEIQEVYDDSEESLIINIPNATDTYEPEVKQISFDFEQGDFVQTQSPEEQMESSYYEEEIEDRVESEIEIQVEPSVVETPAVNQRITKKQLLVEAIRERITNQTPIIKELHAFPVPSISSPKNHFILNAKEKVLVGNSNLKPTKSYSNKFHDQKQEIQKRSLKDTGNASQRVTETKSQVQNSHKYTNQQRSEQKQVSRHVRSPVKLDNIRPSGIDNKKAGNFSQRNQPTYSNRRDLHPVKS